jgi:hypothetical protein
MEVFTQAHADEWVRKLSLDVCCLHYRNQGLSVEEPRVS